MSNFERDVANTMLDAADSRTAHEKTRIRQLEDAAAHWEHKYANARQYNRNLEERIAALEARCAAKDKVIYEFDFATIPKLTSRIADLVTLLREAIEWNWITAPEDIDVSVRDRINAALATAETVCVHEWGEYSINNAKSPLDPPLLHVWVKCIKCGAKSEEIVSRASKETAVEVCRSCGKPPGQHDDDCINHAGQFGYEPNRRGQP